MKISNLDDLQISRAALNDYGSHEDMIRAIRARRPLDLNAEEWRRQHPDGSFDAWRSAAHSCLLDGLHYDPGELDLKPEILDREKRDGFTLERIAFNTTPWIRVEGFFLLPDTADHLLPALVVFHAWGGPMLFGKERIVSTGRDHPLLAEHRENVYSGNYSNPN